VPTSAVEAAALTRIAELEQQLAHERSESSRRLKEVEPRIREFRDALQSMNLKLKQAAEERMVVDARLAGEIGETERLTRRVEELEAQIALERAKPPERAPSKSEVTGEFQPVAAADLAELPPDVIGLRIDGKPELSPLGRRYAAHDTDERRDVSILVFSNDISKLNGTRLDALLCSKHPNLAAAIAFGRTHARPYVVFERSSEDTLEDCVRHSGPVAEKAALSVALQITRGLREAAFKGALHGDLSPRLVRIDEMGDLKIEDTGLGELHPPASRPLRAPEYAAPERLLNGTPADARADIFSLGAVLHFLLTARAPFEADARRPAGPGPDPRKRRPTLSPEISALVSRFMSNEASARPATWDEALAAIEALAIAVPAARPRAEEPSALSKFVAAHPFATTAIVAAPVLAAALWLRFGAQFGPTARERFDAAVQEADAMAARGDPVGAAYVLGRYLTDTGDPAVEREAAARLTKLRLR
jgi:hypothetical protein